jgi:hypothetical protein
MPILIFIIIKRFICEVSKMHKNSIKPKEGISKTNNLEGRDCIMVQVITAKMGYI